MAELLRTGRGGRGGIEHRWRPLYCSCAPLCMQGPALTVAPDAATAAMSSLKYSCLTPLNVMLCRFQGHQAGRGQGGPAGHG